MKKYEINIPNILYKYRFFNEEAERILLNGEIYFATTNELNDPCEKFFRFKNGEYINDINNQLRYLNPEQLTQHFLDAIRTGKNEPYGILSLCDSKEEIKMYKEYADEFKGLCIGFDWNRFGLMFAGSYPPQVNIPRRVTYQPLIEIETTHVPPETWLEIFTSKIPEYSHEKECRMFYTKGKLISNAIRHAIKEIVFGHHMPQEHILKIKNMIQDLRSVSLFKTKIIEDTVNIEPFNY